MKHLKLTDVTAWLLLAILVGLVLHTPLVVWLTSQGAPVYVKAWKEVLLLGAAVLLLVEILRHRHQQILNDKMLWLIAGYTVLHIVTAAWTSAPFMSIASGLLIDLRYVTYFAVVYVFLRVHPQYRPLFIKAGLIGTCVVVGFSLLQLVLPHNSLAALGYSKATIQPYLLLDENPAYVRMNSTLRGPNPLGAYAMMVLLGVIAYGMAVGRSLRDNRKKYLHLFLATGGIVALWASYSRSAWLGLAAGIIVLLAIRYGRAFGLRQVLAVVLLTVSIGLIGYAVRDTDAFKNLVLHDNPTTGAEYTSDQGHKDSLMHGIDRMIHQPFGAGIGSTGSASLATDKPLVIENQYLMVAHEVGWLGLALFMVIWVMVLWRLWKGERNWLTNTVLASGIGLMAISLTWPVLVDDPVSMIWWGMAAVALVPQVRQKGKKRGTTTHKKAA